MENRQVRLPRLNLARVQATEVVLQVSYDWTPERSELFSDLLEPLPDQANGTYVSFSEYAPSGAAKVRHYIIASVMRWQSDDEQASLHLFVRYTLSNPTPPVAIPRSLRRESQLAPRIFALGSASRLWSSVEFRFPKRPSDALWFPLPTRLSGEGTLPGLFEIRGVRGVKLVDEPSGDSEYSFTLDQPQGNDIFVDVRSDMTEPFTPQLPRRILARAHRIALGLVGPEPKQEDR